MDFNSYKKIFINMKFDIKIWIIGVLFLTSGIFLYKWLTSEDKSLKEENKRLLDQVNLIQLERDSLASERKLSKIRFDSIQNIINVEDLKIQKLNKDLEKSKFDLSVTKGDLDRERKKLDEINSQIKELKEHPIKREGGDLLKSLQKKLK